jgi:hypothetical protein
MPGHRGPLGVLGGRRKKSYSKASLRCATLGSRTEDSPPSLASSISGGYRPTLALERTASLDVVNWSQPRYSRTHDIEYARQRGETAESAAATRFALNHPEASWRRIARPMTVFGNGHAAGVSSLAFRLGCCNYLRGGCE